MQLSKFVGSLNILIPPNMNATFSRPAKLLAVPLLAAVLLLQATLNGALAADSSAPERVALWSAPAPASDGSPKTTNAFITVFRPSQPNGAAMIICPGGGYGGLVTGPEGTGIAKWLNQHGVTGIVLEYRLPNGHSAPPLLDAQRALRTVRARAKAWGCDPKRIGIIGFSAGGHLAATAATHFDGGNPKASDPVERLGCRPDFAVLIYPVITMGEKTHGGSRANLLGPNPTADAIAFYSNERQVTGRTCPSFLAHAADDAAVSPDNSRMFYEALQTHKVPARYLELPSGGHGLNGYQGPMWDAWQTESLQWLAARKVIPAAAAPGRAPKVSRTSFPKFATLAGGPQQVRLLPGQHGVVFSMYGAPGDLTQLRQLVGVMRDEPLGNGFDPGPSPQPNTKPIFDYLATVGWPVMCYPGGDMQVKGGRGALGPENQAALAAMDQAGVFTAIQLGEWGYYFHNLAATESWWRDNFGKDFDTYKHLMKPRGLAGYDRRPTSKQECYDVVQDYFLSKSHALLDRVTSVTGHSHYEAYAGEWGARCIGLELGENIAFTQSKLAFARGASRQWQKPWSVQISPWLNGACTSSGPLRKEGNDARGLDAGHSLSFYERMWLHAWFAGAALVTPENSLSSFFEKSEAPWTLTSHGRKAAEVFRFLQTHDRGVPYTPVAVVLDHLAGYNAYMDKPWGILQPTAGDRQLRDLFDHQLFPGSDHIHTNPFPNNPELSYLRPTPYGEIFDVQLTSASAQTLASYPAILLAGDIEFDDALVAKLASALTQGRTLLLAPAHREALGPRFARLAKHRGLEVLPPWTNPATGRSTAIPDARLQRLVRESLPVEVAGDPIQYQVNRTRTGWVIELVNNAGVVKQRDQPAIVDPGAIARVALHPRVPYASAREWRSNRTYQKADAIHVEVGPGQSVFVELVCP
jgi:acetyl esterase/lipase